MDLMSGQHFKPSRLRREDQQFYLTITIFQLNKEGLIIHEVIEIGNDVVVLQHGQDAYFIHDIPAFLFREGFQDHLLPNH